MKTLMLISGGLGRPSAEETDRLAAADQFPRVRLFEQVLNTDLLPPEALGSAPRLFRMVYRYLPEAAAQALEAFRIRNRYDAILTWSERRAFAFALIKKITRVKIPHIPLLYWMSKQKQAPLLRATGSAMDCIVTWSSVQRQYAIDHLGISPSKILLVRHPIDQKFYRPMEGPGDMICAVGSENRDYGTLITALTGSDIHCHIASRDIRIIQGNSARTISVNSLGALPPNMTLGYKSYAELRELYRRSRFAVVPLYPSDTDNGITVILEAMAMGKPVICSRTKGQVDVIEEGKTGLFVEQGNPRMLREAIEHLWNSPAEVQEMGRAARAFVERYHSIDLFTETVRSIVEDVIAGRQPHVPAALTPVKEQIASQTGAGSR
ncbi:MAG TPA: glycosyltransferase family 4 protein [Bacteroidota bacterium]|nr:glycosyltransferase family 4 protein [Bacteroidota bacterium]